MPGRSTAEKPLTVPVVAQGRPHVDIQRLDIAWNEAVGAQETAPRHVCLDFDQAQYIDQELLLFLLGLIYWRHRGGQSTVLRLPQSPHALDFLRAWRFPEAVELVTGEPFTRFLTPGSCKLFADAQRTTPRYVQIAALPDGGRESLMPVSFFAVTPVSLEDPDQAATLVRDEWLDAHLLSVLDLQLEGRASRVATSVLHEGVLNAAMHPEAKSAFTSSQVLSRPRPTERPSGAGERELVISIWDDGASFAQTLGRARKVYGSIASPAYGQSMDVFDVIIQDQAAPAERLEISASMPAASFKRESTLTVAAFLLGITSTPERRKPPSRATPTEEPEIHLDQSGIGLHIIRKTVIDLFGGSLLYATGRIRVMMTAGQSRNRYDVKVTRRSKADLDLGGNLLVARMRLRAPRAAGA